MQRQAAEHASRVAFSHSAFLLGTYHLFHILASWSSLRPHVKWISIITENIAHTTLEPGWSKSLFSLLLAFLLGCSVPRTPRLSCRSVVLLLFSLSRLSCNDDPERLSTASCVLFPPLASFFFSLVRPARPTCPPRFVYPPVLAFSGETITPNSNA
ncbi:hypothetical protein F5Y06DRAFT_42555 [Hypoxylon sp. FL0890]|nr:hypothetical protein F5Y06DRAFT_42555 [Hypoxylon sp. FL0890]